MLELRWLGLLLFRSAGDQGPEFGRVGPSLLQADT